MGDTTNLEDEATGQVDCAAPLRVIGKYELRSIIGTGGTATVYRGFDTHLGREVAVKLLLPELLHHQDFLRRFQQEAKTVAALNHPNIVQLYDYAADAETQSFYLITELIDGPALSALMIRDRVIWEEITLMIIDQVLKGLEFAHGRGLVHRDIKPGNILISKTGLVKISDFGLAKGAGGESQDLTQTGIFVGTPSFSSPEQIEGEPLDHRSDLFSLGTLMFMMVTGVHPFKEKDEKTARVWYRILHGERPRVRALQPSISAEFEAVIDRALQTNPNHRFATTAEMREAVESILRARSLFNLEEEISRLLAAPKRFERLAERVLAEAERLLNAGRSADAHDALARSLMLDRENLKANRLKQKLSRRQHVGRALRVVALSLAVGLMGLVTMLVIDRFRPPVAPPTAPVSSEKSSPPLPSPLKPALPVKLPSEARPSSARSKPKPKMKPVAKTGVSIRSDDSVQLFLTRSPIDVRLAWTAVNGADYYRVDLSTDATFATVDSEALADSPLTSFRVSTPGEYHWRVIALNSRGRAEKELGPYRFAAIRESEYRSRQKAERLPMPVDDSRRATQIELNPAQSFVRLIWNQMPAAKQYRVEVSREPTIKETLFFKSVSTRAIDLDGAIDSGGAFFWRVSALDEYAQVFYTSEPFRLDVRWSGGVRMLEIEAPAHGAVEKSGFIEARGAVPEDSVLTINGAPVALVRTESGALRFSHSLAVSSRSPTLILFELRPRTGARRQYFYRIVNG